MESKITTYKFLCIVVLVALLVGGASGAVFGVLGERAAREGFWAFTTRSLRESTSALAPLPPATPEKAGANEKVRRLLAKALPPAIPPAPPTTNPQPRRRTVLPTATPSPVPRAQPVDPGQK